MTIPTHDPQIEQEAARMLSELEKLCVRGRGPSHSSGSTVEVLHSDMFGLLRDLAALRRQTNERAEIVSALPDSFFADRSLSERVLRMVREWQRVLTILQKQKDREELATLRRGAAKPVDEAEEIEYCTNILASSLSVQQLEELRKWWDAFGGENTPAAVLKMVNELLELRRQSTALRAFKTYVHQRLDEAGVPTHPDGKHSREGCRVGDRLDILVERANAMREACRECMKVVDEAYEVTGHVKVATTSEQRMRIEAAIAGSPAAKPFDDATLREIEERAAKATGGPWFHKVYVVPGDIVHAIETEDGSELGKVWGDDDDPECWPITANAVFVAHAREDIPYLLAALRSRGGEGEIAALRDENEYLQKCVSSAAWLMQSHGMKFPERIKAVPNA